MSMDCHVHVCLTLTRTVARSARIGKVGKRGACKYERGESSFLSGQILFGEASLRQALREFNAHYHGERNHQGKNNGLLFPCARAQEARIDASVACRERLGGLLKYYHLEAA